MLPIVSILGLLSLKKALTAGFLNVRICLNLSVISTKCEHFIICYHPPESIHEPQNNQVGRMTLLVDISDLSMTTAGWHVALQSKVPTVLMHVEANTMAQAFEKREFCCKVNRQEDRQGSNLSPRSANCSHFSK